MDFRLNFNRLTGREALTPEKVDISKRLEIGIPVLKKDAVSLDKNHASGLSANIFNEMELLTDNNVLADKVANVFEELKPEKDFTPEHKEALQNLDPVNKYLFVKSLNELNSYKEGKIKAADYMMNVMSHAADLAGNDNKKFVTLLGNMFAEKPMAFDRYRKLLGAGPHAAGHILEMLNVRVQEQRGGSAGETGFNPNMLEDLEPEKNTMTHHFGEFIRVGFHSGSFLGKMASLAIDQNLLINKMVTNHGDLRSGYFAVMLGDALGDEKITPQDAIKLTRWAYTTDHGGKKAPPFGSEEKQGAFLKFWNYRINTWIKEYNKAFPHDPIIKK